MAFWVKRVDEAFDPASGMVLITMEGGTLMPMDAEAYAASKRLVSESTGILMPKSASWVAT